MKAENRLLILITILTLIVIGLGLVGFELYPCFYHYRSKPWGGTVSWGMIAAAFLILWFSIVKLKSSILFITLAVVAGTFLQFGFALTEGRGFDGMRDRTVKSGHAEFARVAIGIEDVGKTLSNYEGLVTSGKLGSFARSKPPGQLLFYIVFARLSDSLSSESMSNDARLSKLQDLIAIVWPFLAALAVLPLYGFTNIVAGSMVARIAAALYVLTPSFNLVTLHTDQVLFPFLFMSCLYLGARFLRLAHAWPRFVPWGIGAGIMIYVATFFQFPLALVSVFFCGLALTTQEYGKTSGAQIRALGVLGGFVVAGFLLASLSVWIGMDYDPVARWRASLAFHSAWRGNIPSVLGLHQGSRNLIEFVDWSGLPVSILAASFLPVALGDVAKKHGLRLPILRVVILPAAVLLLCASVGWKNVLAMVHWLVYMIPIVALIAAVFLPLIARYAAKDRRLSWYFGISASLAIVLVYLAFFSRTVAEIGRLWIFLIPIMCALAAVALADLMKRQKFALVGILILQIASVVAVKVTRDFF